MAKTREEVLQELFPNDEEITLEELLAKLKEHTTLSDRELRLIISKSIQPLPNVVKNQAEELKARMVNIVTDEDKGAVSAINKRVVLIDEVINKVVDSIDNKANKNELIDFINQTNQKLELKADKLVLNEVDKKLDEKINTVSSDVLKLNNKLIDNYYMKNETYSSKEIDTKIANVKVDLSDYSTTNETLAEINKAVNKTQLEDRTYTDSKIQESKTYTDGKVREVKNTVSTLIGNAPEAYDTLAEIAEYIESDQSGASELLAKINQNTTDIKELGETVDDNFTTLNDNIELKADIDYVDKEVETVENLTHNYFTLVQSKVAELKESKADADSVYTKNKINSMLTYKAEVNDVYNKTETYNSTEIDNKLNLKANQNDLENFRTIYDAHLTTQNQINEEINTEFDKINSSLETKANANDVYNKNQIDEKFANIESPEVDLTNVYSKEEVDNKVSTLETSISNAESNANSYTDEAISKIPTTDLTGYATENYVDDKIEAILGEGTDPDTIDSLKEVIEYVNANPNADLVANVQKNTNDIASLGDLAHKDSLSAGEVGAYTTAQTDSKIATNLQSAKDYTDNQIANIDFPKTDLTGYAKTADLGNLAFKDSLTKEDVGLGSVNNTSDLNKPISTATQTALDLKANNNDLNNAVNRISNLELNKQDNLTANQTNAVNSGITKEKVFKYAKVVNYSTGKIYIESDEFDIADLYDGFLILLDSRECNFYVDYTSNYIYLNGDSMSRRIKISHSTADTTLWYRFNSFIFIIYKIIDEEAQFFIISFNDGSVTSATVASQIMSSSYSPSLHDSNTFYLVGTTKLGGLTSGVDTTVLTGIRFKKGEVTASKFITSGGTTSQVVLGDGSLKAISEITGSVDLTGFYTKTETDNLLKNKQNSLGYTPVNKAGDTVEGNIKLKKQGSLYTYGIVDSTEKAGFCVANGVNPPIPAIITESGRIIVCSDATSNTGYILTLPTANSTLLSTNDTSFTQTQTNGIKLGAIKIGGTSQNIYAPRLFLHNIILKTDEIPRLKVPFLSTRSTPYTQNVWFEEVEGESLEAYGSGIWVRSNGPQSIVYDAKQIYIEYNGDDDYYILHLTCTIDDVGDDSEFDYDDYSYGFTDYMMGIW